jgi:hypothetical protein
VAERYVDLFLESTNIRLLESTLRNQRQEGLATSVEFLWTIQLRWLICLRPLLLCERFPDLGILELRILEFNSLIPQSLNSSIRNPLIYSYRFRLKPRQRRLKFTRRPCGWLFSVTSGSKFSNSMYWYFLLISEVLLHKLLLSARSSIIGHTCLEDYSARPSERKKGGTS